MSLFADSISKQSEPMTRVQVGGGFHSADVRVQVLLSCYAE